MIPDIIIYIALFIFSSLLFYRYYNNRQKSRMTRKQKIIQSLRDNTCRSSTDKSPVTRIKEATIGAIPGLKPTSDKPITELFTDILEKDLSYAQITRRIIPMLAYDKTLLLEDLANNVEILLKEFQTTCSKGQ